MATEDEGNNQNPNDNQQQQVDASIGDVSKELDNALDSLIQQTSRDGQTPPNTQQQQTPAPQQQPGVQQPQQQPNKQQQTPARLEQDPNTPTPHSPLPQTPRQYGSFFRSDSTGAIVDAAGNRIANPGLERRVFDRVHRVYHGMEIEHAAVKQRLEGYENADSAARDAGLSMEERAVGLRLMTSWKTDKLGTLKFLLNQATQAGIDTSTIVQGGGLDPAALRTMLQEQIDKALAPFQPFVQQQQQTAAEAEARSNAAQVISEFYEEFPAAKLHGGVIAAIMGEKGWTMREAFFALQTHAVANRWDITKPLQAQAQASLQTPQGQRRTPTGGGNPQLPAINGRGGHSGGTVPNDRGAASADDSWDNIVAGVLTDHGIPVQ